MSTYRIKLVWSDGSEVTDAYVKLYCHGSGGNTGSHPADWGKVVIDTVGFGKADVYVTRHYKEQLVGQVPGPGAYTITMHR
jgi:hypothetical protein